MKRTDDGRWCHIVCAMWIPGPGFGNPATREPIEGIEYVSMGTGICQGDAPKGEGGGIHQRAEGSPAAKSTKP